LRRERAEEECGMSKAWLAGLSLVALTGASAGADEWSHRYSLQGKPSVHVVADDASVRVEAGDGAAVEARVTTTGWKIAPGEVTITEHQTGDRVDIEVRKPRALFGFGSIGRSIAVELRVPKAADLDVKTGDGSIKAGAVSGNVSLSTGDGSLTADGLEGVIRLHTGDGSIRGTDLSGRLQADTGDGHMDVRGRFDSLDLRSGDGGIEAAALQGSKLEEAWSLHTGDGSVTLRLPEGIGAELDAHTGDGSIVLEKPLTVTGTIRKNAVRGTLGPGGPPLKVQTGDGSIRLLGL
jgi:DUF4097 and DUF4098 domain-containing protein YvlB